MNPEMRLLLDSQTLIWLLYDSSKVGPRSQNIVNEASVVYVSMVSFWELAIKFDKNKTRLPYSPEELLAGAARLGLERLPLTEKHVIGLRTIVTPHNDPFDRMLLAQCESESCVLLTSDKELLGTRYHTRNVGD